MAVWGRLQVPSQLSALSASPYRGAPSDAGHHPGISVEHRWKFPLEAGKVKAVDESGEEALFSGLACVSLVALPGALVSVDGLGPSLRPPVPRIRPSTPVTSESLRTEPAPLDPGAANA